MACRLFHVVALTNQLSHKIRTICMSFLSAVLRKLALIYIVYVIESAAYGVLFTCCLCQKLERARYERVRAFDTNNE